MIDSPSHILVIKSERSELCKVERFLSQVFLEYKLTSSCFNKVFLCVSEAVVNAIDHGNKKVAEKNITIALCCCNDRISICVSDQGEGFDSNAVGDPTQSHNLLKESGRGIHIIRSLSQSLCYNKKGNSVLFQINC